MSGSCNNHFGISISDLEQGRIFPLKGFLSGDVIAYLNIYLLTASLCNKVDFPLIELTHINIISTAKQFNTNDILIYSAIVHVSAAEYCITDTGITQIELLGAFQIFLPSNVITFNIIKHESIAQIFNVFANGYMIGSYFIRSQQTTHFIWRSQIADIIHQKFT